METKTQPVEIVNFVSIIHKFFTDVKTFEESTTFLKKYTKHKIQDYPINTSRKIFYSLIIYKFGKELDYPESLQSKARQLILFHLKENTNDISNDHVSSKKSLVKDFLDEFEKYKSEDFKNYMYELAVQYNQLSEMFIQLTEYPEWRDAIQGLQDKILNQVKSLKGENIFKECLDILGQLKKEIIKEHLVNAYWDMMLEELSQKKYNMMMKNYVLIKDILLEIRDEQDTKETLDEKYIQQLLDNDIFTEKTLISQIEFIFHKIKVYGIPIYDKLIEKTKNNLVQDIREKGISPELVTNVFKRTVPILQSYIEIIRIYRKKIIDIKNDKQEI